MGLYGVVAYALSQRTPQLGIRIALGARPRHLAAVLLAEGLLPALAGAGAGLLAAVALTSSGILDGLLFEVSPRDPWSFGAGAALLLLAALLACGVPAWRARRIDAATALRSE
jgi:ABC-type antimicrobial peptide transport system permease subunit